MTLSPKQKEVIRLMREGWWELTVSKISGKVCLWDKHLHEMIISDTGVDTLIRDGLISRKRSSKYLTLYRLTDLGKTIEI